MTTMDELNRLLMESTKKPRISGLNIHFTDNGEAHTSVTVSIGRSGMGYGNMVLDRHDERLKAIYELIRDVLRQSS